MPLFSYKASDKNGKVQKDLIEARDRANAASQLQSMGLIPLSITEARSSQSIVKGMKISKAELRHFTQELSTLVGAGIPLSRALTIIQELYREQRLGELVGEIHEAVRGGKSLSEALEAHPRIFTPMYTSLIRAGEASGRLTVILNRLAQHLERSEDLRREVVSSMIYPAVLIFISLIAITVLMTFVVPKFVVSLKKQGLSLPLPTMILVTINDFLMSGWARFVGLGLLVALISGFVVFIKTAEGRQMWDGGKLKLPVIGDLLRKMEIARFSQTMSTLLENGVAILDALDIARNTVSNIIIRQALDNAGSNLRSGKPMSQPLLDAGCFPPIAVNMIRVGEETARLPEMFAEIADRFSKETRAAADRVMRLIEPSMIIVLGGIIGFIVVSIVLAIVKTYSAF